MSVPLAVLETAAAIDVVRTGEGSWRVSKPITSLADLEAIARRIDTHQLWLHPSWSIAHPDVALCGACAELRGADKRGDAPGGTVDRARRRQHQHWLALGDGSQEARAASSVAHPQLAIVHGDKALQCLAGARDGRELLGTLSKVSYLLGTHWHGTPGATGIALLRECLRRAGRELEPLPMEVRRLGPEPDFGWARPLTPRELERRWVYVFDKHNQYLTAAGTVALGAGSVEFAAGPAFHARQPGWWHVKLSPWTHPTLPDPTRGAGPPRDPDAYRWLTTPSVEAAITAGTLEAIAAAWYWPQHGTYLQTVSKLLRAALNTCTTRAAAGDHAAGLLRAALKAIYAELLSGYLARNALAESDDPLYRPDWRDALKAEARTRLWYSLRPLAAAELAPIAVEHDAIYIPSDADDANDALAGLLRMGALPAQWAFQKRVALADVRDHLVERVGASRSLTAAVGAATAA